MYTNGVKDPFSCNGKKPKCKDSQDSQDCYNNGGPCKATTDIEYARVYIRKEDLYDTWYEELGDDERI